MTNFEQIREQVKKVFFENKNFLYTYGFLYDFMDNKIIQCEKENGKSNGSCVSFTEYALVYDKKDIFLLIGNEYYSTEDDYDSFVYSIEKLFDEWFEEFYNSIMNMDVNTSCVGTKIHKEYCEKISSIYEAIDYYSNGYTD